MNLFQSRKEKLWEKKRKDFFATTKILKEIFDKKDELREKFWDDFQRFEQGGKIFETMYDEILERRGMKKKKIVWKIFFQWMSEEEKSWQFYFKEKWEENSRRSFEGTFEEEWLKKKCFWTNEEKILEEKRGKIISEGKKIK